MAYSLSRINVRLWTQLKGRSAFPEVAKKICLWEGGSLWAVCIIGRFVRWQVNAIVATRRVIIDKDNVIGIVSRTGALQATLKL